MSSVHPGVGIVNVVGPAAVDAAREPHPENVITSASKGANRRSIMRENLTHPLWLGNLHAASFYVLKIFQENVWRDLKEGLSCRARITSAVRSFFNYGKN